MPVNYTGLPGVYVVGIFECVLIGRLSCVRRFDWLGTLPRYDNDWLGTLKYSVIGWFPCRNVLIGWVVLVETFLWADVLGNMRHDWLILLSFRSREGTCRRVPFKYEFGSSFVTAIYF